MIESNETSALAWAHWQHSTGDIKMIEKENSVITFMYQLDSYSDLRCFIPESVKYFIANNELLNRN